MINPNKVGSRKGYFRFVCGRHYRDNRFSRALSFLEKLMEEDLIYLAIFLFIICVLISR
jgi:hypothetical protein